MLRSSPKIVVVMLLVGYLICSPIVAMANTTATTSPKTSVAERHNIPTAEQTAPATRSDTKAGNVLPKQESKARAAAKNNPTLKKVRINKKWAHSRALKLSPKPKALGAGEDCDACHDQCLVASLTCIAISIATGCLPCGGICLAGQLACGTICNGTTACKNAQTESPPVN